MPLPASMISRRRLWMLVGALCGGASWPVLTLLVVWTDDANLMEGPLLVIFIPLFLVWSFLGIPSVMLGRGYVTSAVVVLIWAAAGAMLAARVYARRRAPPRADGCDSGH